MNILEKYRAVYAPDGAQSGATGSPDNATASTPSGAPSTPSSTPAASSSPRSDAQSGGNPGGGTSTPPTTPPAGGDSASGEDFFSAIFNGGESLPAPSPPAAPAAGTTGTQPPAPATPPAAEKPAAPVAPATPAAVTPAQEPAAVPPQPATPVAAQAPAERQLDRYDPGALSQHLRQNEAAAIDYVAQNVFKLSPEDVEALETDVVGTVPKLLAKAFVMSQQNVLTQLASIVPTMIQRQTEAMRRHGENEAKFYAAWPAIKQGEHGAIVTKYAAVYRQMHPEATLEQMIQDVGPMVMMAARVPATAPAAAAGLTPAQTPSGAVAPVRPPQPSPFVPGGAGAGPVSNGTVVEPEPWEAMFQPRE